MNDLPVQARPALHVVGLLSLHDVNTRLEQLAQPAPRIVLVPGGQFLMGNEAGPASERPVHAVSLTAFGLAETPITVAQFAAFVADTGYTTEAELPGPHRGGWVRDPALGAMIYSTKAAWHTPHMPQTRDHPVVLVSWNDANAYARWLSDRTGLVVSLPTEAQWEYACRAGQELRASPNLDCCAWHLDNSSGHTHPVAQKEPNAWGLYDMLGNVWEWTLDSYTDYGARPRQDPAHPEDNGRGRVARGGSWNLPPSYARPTLRQEGRSPHARAQDLGFRVAVSLTQTDPAL